MNAQQMEAWKNLLVALIPAAVMLAAAIIVLKKHRGWYSILLVAAAVLVILLPIISQVILNNVMELAEQIKAMPTQQQQDTLNKNKPYIESCNVYLKWLNDGRYLATMAFAIALFITIGAILPKSADAVARQPSPTAEGKAPDAS